MTNTCFMCGATIEINKKQKYVCEECDRKIKLLKQLTNVDKAKEKIEKKAKRKRIKDLDYEQEACEVARKIMSEGYVFNSVNEICFAIQLEKENIKYYPNYKIGECRVDFFIPDLKKIVEVDGEIYHTDENKDFLRERKIMSCIDNGYEIVRIPASFVPDYILLGLKEGLDFIVDKRKFDNRFRDTRFDKIYWEEFINYKYAMRRAKL